MLGKLFKYELLDLFKKTILFFSIVIILSLLVFLFGKLGEKIDFFIIVNTLLIMGYFFSIAGILIYSVFYPITRFYKSMLKDEGYLTHTLPVEKRQLLFAKLTCAFLLFLASVLVAIGSLLLTDLVDINSLKLIVESFHKNKFLSYSIIIIYLVVYYFSMVMLFITAMTIGHSRAVKKGINSVFAGLIIYGIQQALGMIAIGILFLISNNIFEEIAYGEVSYLVIIIIPMITYAILITAEILTVNYFLKNKLNLE